MVFRCEFPCSAKKDFSFLDINENLVYEVESVRKIGKNSILYLKDSSGDFLYWMMKKSKIFHSEYIIDDFVSGKPTYAYCRGKRIYIFLDGSSSFLVLVRHIIRKDFEIYLDNKLILSAYSDGFFSMKYTLNIEDENYTELCLCLVAILYDIVSRDFKKFGILNRF